MSKLVTIAVSFLSVACAAQRPTESRPAAEPAGRHVAFDRILRANVRDERVDYLTIRDRRWSELTGYLDRLAETDVGELKSKEQLALYINLYNATMIRAVIERLVDGYTPAANDYGIFEEPLVRVSGKKISLNHLEHEIVRKRFDEPRIHVALVCGARSCPPLLARAYRAKTLDADLEQAMRRFVRDDSRNRVSARRLELSKIFEWYQDDFGGSAGVPKYIGRYAGVDVSGAAVSYLEYSWELNLARPRDGDWVVVKGGELKGRIVEALERSGGRVKVRLPFARGDKWLEAREVARF